MRMQKSDDYTVAVVGSMTAALGAQHALAGASIRSNIVKHDASQKSAATKGCSYGVIFHSAQLNNAKSVLSAANIRTRYIREDGWYSL